MMLLNNLKRKLILSHIEKKKVKEPFDAEAAELYELPADSDINQNNSHFFTASDAATGETLSIRLGRRNGSDCEIFVLYKKGPRFLVHESDSYSADECPVTFECLEIARRWKVTFNGRLKDSANSEVKDAVISVDFEASAPIYDFFYHADRFTGMAESIAREKWNREFFADLAKNNQRHYEQPGRIRGSMTFGEETFGIDLCCVRDHSFGCREWDLMNDHIWLLGVTESGKVLSYSIVNYPRLKRIYSGYTNIFTDELLTLRNYKMIEYDAAGGLGGDKMKLFCEFSEGRTLDVSIHRDANVKCSFGGGKYIFQEGLADFVINGEKGRGTLEYGFNSNSSRWEI